MSAAGGTPAIPTPTVHLKFENDSLDSSGNGYDFTNTSVTFSSGTKKTGSYSAYFNGAAQLTRANQAALNPRTGEFAFCFWFNKGTATAYHNWGNTTDSDGVELQWNGNTDIRWYGTHATQILTASTGDNAWHWICIQRTATQMEMYLDNATTPSVTFSGTNWNADINPTGLYRLGNVYNSSVYYTGYLDDFRAHIGFSLTQAQREAIYNSGTGTEAP